MKKLIIFIIFSNLFAIKPAISGDYIIAKINNKAVTKLEAKNRYRFVLFSSKIKVESKVDKKLLFDQVVDKMVDEELIRQEAARLQISVGKSEIQSAFETLAQRQKKNAAQLKFKIISKGFAFEDYLKQIESEILWSKIISAALKPKVKVSEVEVREFFEQQKMTKDITKFHIAEILISNSKNAKPLSKKLVLELRNGADFNDVVEQFSDSLSKNNNGEIGWVLHSDIDNKIYQAISKLRKGAYSNPVKLDDGYHIFKLLDARIETGIFPKENLEMAKNIIFSRKLQVLAKGYLMDLRKRAFIEIKH